MTKIHVMSEVQACGIKPRENVWVISISHPEHYPELQDGWPVINRYWFHDILEEEDGLLLFSEMQAENIILCADHFARDTTYDEMLVHCAAGFSRSVAVGMFLADYLSGELILHSCRTTSFYNSHVSRTLRRRVYKGFEEKNVGGQR